MALRVWCSGRIFAISQRGAAPTQVEWDDLLAGFKQRSGLEIRALIDARDAGPNAVQRKALTEVLSDVKFRAAVVTDSLIVRSMITAMTWLGLPLEAFPSSAHAAAADSLGVSPAERTQLLRELAKLCAVDAL